jgi:hypothetical protein
MQSQTSFDKRKAHALPLATSKLFSASLFVHAEQKGVFSFTTALLASDIGSDREPRPPALSKVIGLHLTKPALSDK